MTSIAAVLPTSSYAPQVTLGERLSRFIFGSPSFAYACRDMRLRKATMNRSRERSAFTSREIPVFTIDRKHWKGTERLPRIWLSEPDFDGETGLAQGRKFIEAYPHDPDPHGWHAFGLARKYFSEGLGYSPEAKADMPESERAEAYRMRRVRRDCFRAAEILYLYAARAGNTAAKAGLATLYRFDMCEGIYWSGLLEKRARHRKVIDPQRRAIALFEQLAESDDAESLFQLGEMRAEGAGCARNASDAFTLFDRAFERACATNQRELAGKAALRLADAYAEGSGATHCFDEARRWYAVAVERLQEAFDAGEWHCKPQLVAARLGVARMDQELCGQY